MVSFLLGREGHSHIPITQKLRGLLAAASEKVPVQLILCVNLTGLQGTLTTIRHPFWMHLQICSWKRWASKSWAVIERHGRRWPISWGPNRAKSKGRTVGPLTSEAQTLLLSCYWVAKTQVVFRLPGLQHLRSLAWTNSASIPVSRTWNLHLATLVLPSSLARMRLIPGLPTFQTALS